MRHKEKRAFLGTPTNKSNTGKFFARKVMRVTQVSDEDVKNEVKVIDSLRTIGRHQNIIDILKHGWLYDDMSHYFIDMELADLTLSDYIRYAFHNRDLGTQVNFRPDFNPIFASRECSRSQRLHSMWIIGHQIASGLEFLHKNGHVHRDLNPKNGIKATVDFA
jgi:serine/threonine protein kinase